MDLSLNQQQSMLKSAASAFIKKEAPPHKITEWSKNGIHHAPDLYRQVAEFGWLGMVVPERYGGLAASLTDCAVVFEELGRGPLPGPYFSSGVLGALTILEGGTDEQKEQWLPAICEGRKVASLAIADVSAGWGPEAVEMQAVQRGGDIVVSGRKMFVHDAEAADTLVCAVRLAPGQSVTLVLVNKDSPGVSVHRPEGFLTCVAEVRFDNVLVPEAHILGQPGTGWETLERAMGSALPILCAYQVGGCQQVFEFTAEYTRTRVVFGQPIGRFQRVQDHCIELSIHMDGARWLTYETLWKLEAGMPALASVHEAKAVASEAYYQVCNYSHMVHAGPGTAVDHPLVPHTIMSRVLYQYLGDPPYHKRKMIDALYP